MGELQTVNLQIEVLESERKDAQQRVHDLNREIEKLEFRRKQLTSPFLVVWEHGEDGEIETKYAQSLKYAVERLEDALAFIRERSPYKLVQVAPNRYEFVYASKHDLEVRSGKIYLIPNPESEATE